MSEIMLILDIMIICMLGTTIFYAVRLGKHLNIFRSNRSEMERLIRELSTQITRAQEGITELDDISTTRGEELRRMIGKAQALCDELEIVTEAGDSLAGRLEALATKNREIADDIGQNTLNTVYPGQRLNKTRAQDGKEREDNQKYIDSLPRANKDRIVPSLEPSFAIRDPDYDADETENDTEENEDSYLSKAERELMAALKNHKK